MKKVILIFIILAFCQPAVFANEQIEPEEYAIYKVMLEKLIITSEYQQIFIVNSTRGSTLANLLSSEKRNLSKLKSETGKNYNLRNRRSAEVKNNFSLSLKVNLVTLNELLMLYRNYERDKNYEQTFKEMRTPVQFSRVGFNRAKDQALVEVGTYCGTLCGQGAYYLLTKKNGEWTISQELKTWIS